jgi:hypothetical protein
LALVGLPAVAFAATALHWLRRRQWLPLGLLFLAALLLATVIGVIWVRFPAIELFPEKHYSFRGWYAIWPAGVYAVGVLLLTVYSMRGLIRLVRRRRPRET